LRLGILVRANIDVVSAGDDDVAVPDHRRDDGRDNVGLRSSVAVGCRAAWVVRDEEAVGSNLATPPAFSLVTGSLLEPLGRDHGVGSRQLSCPNRQGFHSFSP
jgi:hypothetical protein